MNMLQAVKAALSSDAELNNILYSLRQKEKQIELTYADSEKGLDQAVQFSYEYTGLLNNYIGRYNSVVEEISNVVIDINLAEIKRVYYTELEDELNEDFKRVETEFKTGKLKQKDRDDAKKLIYNAGNLKNEAENSIQGRKTRFKELTGYAIPSGFAYESAYFIVDFGKIPENLNVSRYEYSIFNISGGMLGVFSVEDIPKLKEDALKSFTELGDTVVAYAGAKKSKNEAELKFKTGKLSKKEKTASLRTEKEAVLNAEIAKATYSKKLFALDRAMQGLLGFNMKPSYNYSVSPSFYKLKSNEGENTGQRHFESFVGSYCIYSNEQNQAQNKVVFKNFNVPNEINNVAKGYRIEYENATIGKSSRVDGSVELDKLSYKFGSSIYIHFTDEEGNTIKTYTINGFLSKGIYNEVVPEADIGV